MTVPADRHRDPAVVARVTAMAARILARYGADATPRRAAGWSNLTWLAGGLAIRVAAAPGDGDLLREARLVSLLPPGVGYPRVVASGVEDGHEWMLAEVAPGTNLNDAWPALTREERARALVELWERAKAVHAADLAVVGAHARHGSPFYPAAPDAAEVQLRRLGLGDGRTAALQAALDRFWEALPAGTPVLNHGDLSVGNALRHGGSVSALLDFEFAVVAPVELDASEMLTIALGPSEEPGSPDDLDPELGDGVTEAVLPALDGPGAGDRLLGYAVLVRMFELEGWLRSWDGREDVTRWQPFRALASLAGGRGSYLAPVLEWL